MLSEPSPAVQQVAAQPVAQPVAQASAATPQAPAQWAPDPFQRHELRYYDGTRWTEYVSNAGVSSTDRAGY